MDVIRRSDPMNRLRTLRDLQDTVTVDDMIEALRNIQAVDAVEVVRCGNCKHYNLWHFDDGTCYGRFCDILRVDMGQNFFCGKGDWRYT